MVFMSSVGSKATAALPSDDLQAAVGVSSHKTDESPKLGERKDRTLFFSVSTVHKTSHSTSSNVKINGHGLSVCLLKRAESRKREAK